MKIYVMIFVVLLTLMTTTASAAEEVVEDWNVTFNGGYDDSAYSVQLTSDGGYIVAGETVNPVSRDMWLVKTYGNGSEEWNVSLNNGSAEYATSVQQTEDDGYIVTGYTNNSVTGWDMWLVKTNDIGSMIWNATFSGGFGNDFANSVQQTDDGYIVAGPTEKPGTDYDMWLVKTNDTGSEYWNATFDGGPNDYARSVQLTNDGGYVIAGHTQQPTTSYDMWLVKTYDNGSEEWNATFDGGSNDYARSVQLANDGYILAGYTQRPTTGYDMWLVKTYSDGSEDWNVTFDRGVDDKAYSVQKTDDGYIVAGYTYNGENNDIWLVKTDTNGSEDWNVTFDSGDNDYARSLQKTDDGYIVAGYTDNGTSTDMLLVKINENRAPVLSPIGDKSVNENAPLTFTVTADDANSGDILIYTSDNLPTSATLNDSTGVFSWTPSESQVGVYSVNFTVSDGTLNDSETININVKNVATSGGSSGGVGTPVIIPIQEETNESEEENTASESNATNNATVVVPDEETPKDEVVEEIPESQEEVETTPGFSIMLTTGILLSAYVIYRRKD